MAATTTTYPAAFTEAKKQLPTKYQCIQELSREMGMRRKVWKSTTRQGKVYFPNVEHQTQYHRLEYAKNILTRMSERTWHELQFAQWQLDQDKQSQTAMF